MMVYLLLGIFGVISRRFEELCWYYVEDIFGRIWCVWGYLGGS